MARNCLLQLFRSRLRPPIELKKANSLVLAACKILGVRFTTMRQLHAIAAPPSRQIILTCFAGRLANHLHALALRTKHRIHKRLPLFGSEALEAGRHDAQARTARLDGRGLERR